MKCRSCNEEYDQELFDCCPYCLAINEDTVESIIEPIVENSLAVSVETCETDEFVDLIVNEPIEEVEQKSVEITVQERHVTTNYDQYLISEWVDLSIRTKYILARNDIETIEQLKDYINSNDINELAIRKRDISKLLELADNFLVPNNISVSLEDVGDNLPVEMNNTDGDSNIDVSDVIDLSKAGILFMVRNDIKTVGQLKEYLQFNSIEDMPIGKKDKKRIFELFDTNGESSNKAFANIHQDLLEADLMMLSEFGVTNKSIQVLLQNGLVKIKHLHNQSIDFLNRLIGKRNASNLLELEILFEKGLIGLLETKLENLSKKNAFDFVLMRAEGFTLQEVGEAKGVTRERVRQVVVKANSTLDMVMTCVVDKFIKEKGYVTLQDILDIYDNDDYDKVLVYWCKCSITLEYLDFAALFVKAGAKEHFFENQIFELVKEFIGEGIDLYQNMEELETYLSVHGFSYIDTSAVINLLKKNRCRVYGSFATPGRVSYGYLCARIIANKFPNGIRIYDNHDLNLLREYVKAEYGDIGLSDEDRSLGTRLAPFLVLSGRGAATAVENIQVDMYLLNEIRDYIDKSSDRQIYYSHLFVEFEGMIRTMSNIDNHHFLHGVLMYFYPNEYSYTRDFLIKQGNEYVSERLSDKVSAYILEQKKPVHKNELKRAFTGRTDITLISAINESKDVFLWDYNYFYSTQLVHCDGNDLDFIESEIRKLLKEHRGYCSAGLLHERIKNSNQIFLEKNLMKSDDNLYQFCAKKLGEKFMFRRPHISEFGLLDELSVKNVAMHLLGNPDKLSYNKYMDMAKSLKWSRVTIRMVFSDIEMDYIRISYDLYLKKDKFDITLESIQAIDDVLARTKRYDFASLCLFDDWEALPNIGFEWNEFLLDAVLKEYSLRFKVIRQDFVDRRYVRSILVDNDSDMKDYIDVVVHLLKLLGKTEVSQKDLLNLLIVNGFHLKVLPQEFYVSDKLEFRNEKFYVVE